MVDGERGTLALYHVKNPNDDPASYVVTCPRADAAGCCLPAGGAPGPGQGAPPEIPLEVAPSFQV
eukprot:3360557-Prymnesium_polylepis.1